MKPQTAKTAMILCSVGALMALLFAMVYMEQETVLYAAGGVGIALMAASYVIQMLFWKCPCCGKELPSRGFWKLTNCPRCKSEL